MRRRKAGWKISSNPAHNLRYPHLTDLKWIKITSLCILQCFREALLYKGFIFGKVQKGVWGAQCSGPSRPSISTFVVFSCSCRNTVFVLELKSWIFESLFQRWMLNHASILKKNIFSVAFCHWQPFEDISTVADIFDKNTLQH